MIYVDPLMHHGAKVYGAICVKSCHMFTDGEVEELDLFADKLGLRREWKQVSRGILFTGMIHYDLFKSKRDLAVHLGAKSVSGREAAKIWGRILRKTRPPEQEKLPF